MKRVVVALCTAAFAVPLLAGTPASHDVMLTAIAAVDDVALSVGDPATAGPSESRTISIVTARGNDDVFAAFVRGHLQPAVAEQLVTSYADAAARTGVLPPDAPTEMLAGGPFRTKEGTVDWARVATAHPEVRSNVILSEPVLDTLAEVAIVRYEAVTPAGSAWGLFQEFDRQADGTWAPGPQQRFATAPPRTDP